MKRIPWVAGREESATSAYPKFRTPTILLLLTLISFSLRASAGLPIEIFDVRNSTRLLTEKGYSSLTHSNILQTLVSPLPLNDQLYSWNGALAGETTTTVFSVSALTTKLLSLDRFTYYGYAAASNEVSFVSLETTTTTLGFEKTMIGGLHLLDNQIEVRLINIDNGQVLLDYHWDRGNWGVSSTQVDFSAGASYKLSIVARTIEDGDGPWDQTLANLRVTGLDPISVPEPTSASIFGLGLLTWWSQRRNKNHAL